MHLKPGHYCFTILEGQRDEHGYIPSLVIEGESGHYPMMGRGPGAAPWYWGETIEEAKEVCRAHNAEMGITRERALEIVASSISSEIPPGPGMENEQLSGISG